MKTIRVILILICTYLTSQLSVAQLPEIPLWNKNTMPDVGKLPKHEKVSKTGAISQVNTPRLRVYQPTQSNHIAILVISGGGYAHEELGQEGTPTALFLQQKGFTVFELIYRLPEEGWTSSLVPFQDGQRALRIVRAHAAQYKVKKIGVLGFSAGGHLAGILATDWERAFYSPRDDIDQISARPNFAALIYPVISMLPPINHTHSYKSLFKQDASQAEQQALSVECLVTKQTPPVFLTQAKDDPISPVQNSVLMHHALDRAQVKNKMVLFNQGGHGWGLGKPNTPTTQWPSLFLKWLEQTI